jgi:hypothetical protein
LTAVAAEEVCMSAPAWPFPSVADPAWLTPPGQRDDHLATARDAVLRLVPVPDDGATTEHLLAALTAAAELAERIDWELLSLVGEARGEGLSWERVAGALGVSKQAAHKRFGPYVAEAVARAAASAPVPSPRAPAREEQPDPPEVPSPPHGP